MKGRTLFSLVLCLLLVVSLTLPVFAEGTDQPGISLSEEEGGEGGAGSGDQGGGSEGSGNEGGGNEGGDQGSGNEGGGSEGGDQGGGNEGGGSEGGDQGGGNEGGSGSEGGSGNEGGEVKPHEHVWEVEESVTKATCTQEGSNKVKCKICGAVETHVVPKLPHSYTNARDPDCNVCYHMRDASHKPSTTWSKNAGGHWHVCTVCGEKVDVADHYPGPAATEDKDQICMTCGYVMTKALGHVHKYKKEYSSDATGHWYACEGCGEKKDFQEHVFDNPCEPVCKVCGYVSDNAHSYGDIFQYDEENHWLVCTICGQEGDHIAHVPGDPATEDTPQVCAVCGMELAPPLNHTHLGEMWTYDEENHQNLCSCGMVMEEGPHTWDEGTENSDGTVTFTCTRCAYQKVEGEPKAAEAEFPWVLVIGGVALVCAVGAAVALIVVLVKKPTGKFSK